MDVKALPGFRRRIDITPAELSVTAELEDDFHRMAVTIHHDGKQITDVLPVQTRAPWTTCDGALNVVKKTFIGRALNDCQRVGGKKKNCTHLFDLTQWAAAHAQDNSATRYDVAVSDPHLGISYAQIEKNALMEYQWQLRGFEVVAPKELAGMPLHQMRSWVESQSDEKIEAARILQWGAMIAHGRLRPMDEQSDASKMPPNCYTFQPDNALLAERVGEIKDFSVNGIEPLMPLHTAN
ncbi:hypothetical protein [Halioxenophilus aromaticivorans]|uniref:DUF2889 domain-containing protein n=1 Tax=Halioxenophilus aromaticivorans TaxID=1306992 RepID=A0AAV3U438_9ALTE